MKIDIYKHCREGRRLWAVPAGTMPSVIQPQMAHSEDMRALRLYRRGLQLGIAQQPVFDYTRVRAEIERQGWAKIILHTRT